MNRSGWLYGLVAYGWWGLMPLYFERVKNVPPFEMLAHRIVWSFLLLGGLITILGRWGEVKRCLVEARSRRLLLVTTVLVGLNWLAYIYAVVWDQVILASLGYFILPLVSVLLGTVLLGERLRPLQWGAVGLAACGVLYLVVRADEWPWLSFVIAVSFGLYGLFRKRVGVDGMIGLTVETLLLFPLSAGVIVWLWVQGTGIMGHDSLQLDGLLLLSGVVTTVPLFCFGEAARRLPLSTLGFMQYLAPTLQLILAVTRLDEDFGRDRQIGFGFIWAALAVFTFASLRQMRQNRLAESLIAPGE